MSKDNRYLLNIFHPYKADRQDAYPKEAIQRVLTEALSDDMDLVSISVQTLTKDGTYSDTNYLVNKTTNYLGMSDISMSESLDNTFTMNADRSMHAKQLQFKVATFLNSLLHKEVNGKHLIILSADTDE